MILLEDDLVMLERFKCEVDILLRIAYKAEDSLEALRLSHVRKQFDCVCDVFEDLKRNEFFSH